MLPFESQSRRTTVCPDPVFPKLRTDFEFFSLFSYKSILDHTYNVIKK